MKKRLIVIGGGAAGFFCAVNAASQSPALEVIIIEKTGKLLSKVRVSGGGRCNVTHACFSIAEMIKKYPRGGTFLKQAFHHFFTRDTIDWFEKRQVRLKTEPDGRMFPESNSAETIINCLMQEANKHGVRIVMNLEVIKIEVFFPGEINSDEIENVKKKFVITCKNDAVFDTDFICIASGGYNKKEQFGWLASLGHHFDAPVPSLFTFNIPANPVVELMGISVPDVVVKIDGTNFSQSGPLLITHWGFSGPAILKLSAFAARRLYELQYDFTISVNWLAGFNESSLLTRLKFLREDMARQKITSRNPFSLPQRLWEYHLKLCEIQGETRWADLPAKQQNLLSRQLCSQQFSVKGKTTFKEEFVTAGGIKLQEADANTMMSKMISHLFFAGEVLDVDGITGGFNFQHAWTSGWIAAREISRIFNAGEKVNIKV
ncbi:MAG: NAD(P)/FAD-dependent oxidoreductase [Ginsengibacter sp.]